jgi:MFS family permease
MASESVPAEPRSILRHPLVLSFYLPSLLLAISNGLIVPVMPLWAKELNISYGLIGLVLSGQGIGMLLGDLPAGVLARRLGQKRAMLLGVACTALSTAALFWVRSVPMALLSRLLAGFGAAVYGVARHAYVAGAVRSGSRGRAISLFGGLMRIGRFVGPLAGGVVATAYGLRSTFLAYGVGSALAIAAIGVFVRSAPGAAGDSGDAVKQAQPVHKGSLWTLVQSHWRVLASAGVGQLFAQTIRAGRSALIPLYAADAIGLDVQQIGLIVSLSSAIDMSLFAVSGLLMDRLGRKFAIVPSFAIQALGMALIPLAGTFYGLLGVTLLIGLGNGIGAGTMMTLGADLAPSEARGEFLGLWRLIGDGGQAGGPLLVGQVADWLALSPAAWVISGAGVMAALIFVFFVPETLKKPGSAVGRPEQA